MPFDDLPSDRRLHSDPRLHSDRRSYLRALATTGIGAGVAGCSEGSNGQAPDRTGSVVFTDGTDATDTVGATEQADGSATAEGETTATGTATPAARVFDGGDSASFAAAVREAARLDVPLEVTPGTYRFDVAPGVTAGTKRPHLEFSELSGLTIEGNGATLVFTNPEHGGLWFRNGANLTIRDLTLDFDPVPYTQGEITDYSTADGTITLALDDGYPSLDNRMFPNASTVYALTHGADGGFVEGLRALDSHDKHFTDIETISQRRFRLHLDERQSDFTGIEPGHRLTVVARDNESALKCYRVTNPSLETVTVRTANGAAFVLAGCERPSIEDSTVAPPPDSNRQLATVADGIRYTNCGGGSLIRDCRHEALGDDSVAIDHHMATVTGFDGDDTVTVDNVHPFLVATGDVLEPIAPNGQVRPDLPPIASFEPRFSPDGERAKPATLTFESAVDDVVRQGDYLHNTDFGSDGYVIQDNVFRNHRANLIRANAGDGLIDGNVLDGVDGSAIELHTGTAGHWPPMGRTDSVVVRRNEIRRAGMRYIGGRNASAIRIHHETPPDAQTEARPNQHVAIVGNDIAECAAVGIEAEATDGLRIEDNTMRSLNQLDYRERFYGVVARNCSDVTVANNEIAGGEALRDGIGFARRVEDFSASGNTLRIDGESEPATVVEFEPVTLSFSRTVVPEAGNRALAFCCFALALRDDDGEPISEVEMGADESGVSFGAGVDTVEQASDGDQFRWFGSVNDAAVLYVPASALDDASTLVLEGYAIESGIAADLVVDGTTTDTIEWSNSNLDTYRLSLSP